jgi:hypothetical protein
MLTPLCKVSICNSCLPLHTHTHTHTHTHITVASRHPAARSHVEVPFFFLPKSLSSLFQCLTVENFPIQRSYILTFQNVCQENSVPTASSEQSPTPILPSLPPSLPPFLPSSLPPARAGSVGGGGGSGLTSENFSVAGGAWRAAPVLEHFGTYGEPCLVALEQQRVQLEGFLAQQAKLRPKPLLARYQDPSSISFRDVNRELERQRRDRETYSAGPARHLRPRGTAS